MSGWVSAHLEPWNGESQSLNQSYRNGSFGSGAPRTPKPRDQVRHDDTDALWWCLPGAPFPLPHGLPSGDCPRDSLGPAEQSVHRRRDAAGAVVPDDPRPGAHRDHPVVATERRLSVLDGAAELSRRHDAPPVSPAGGADGLGPDPARARSLSPAHERETPSPGAAPLRSRLDRARGLWPPGAGEARLQPRQAGSAVLPPVAVLRGPDQGLLARGTPPRRRPHRGWDARPGPARVGTRSLRRSGP
jgi:hypothetical protein